MGASETGERVDDRGEGEGLSHETRDAWLGAGSLLAGVAFDDSRVGDGDGDS